MSFKIFRQLISKIGRVPAQEERGDRTDGSETGHRNWQVSMFETGGNLLSRKMCFIFHLQLKPLMEQQMDFKIRHFHISFSVTYRTLNCMVGQMKHILATEQKKTDFRPEDENNVMIQYTTVRDMRPLPLSSHAKLNKAANAICKSLKVHLSVLFVLRLNKN